jgi:hypothetical protein
MNTKNEELSATQVANNAIEALSMLRTLLASHPIPETRATDVAIIRALEALEEVREKAQGIGW